MPTYQYRCTDCGEPLEAVQSFTDDPLTVCPACQGTLRKVFSSVGVVFKGSGFYRTDSRANGDRPKAGAGEKAEKSDTAGSTAKSESKSDSKSDSSAKDGAGSTKSPAKAGESAA